VTQLLLVQSKLAAQGVDLAGASEHSGRLAKLRQVLAAQMIENHMFADVFHKAIRTHLPR